MTTYTKINKASGTSYTRVSAGNVFYNDSSITYDNSTVNFDGLFNQSAYVNISKATGGSLAYTDWNSLGSFTWFSLNGRSWGSITGGVYKIIPKAL